MGMVIALFNRGLDFHVESETPKWVREGAIQLDTFNMGEIQR